MFNGRIERGRAKQCNSATEEERKRGREEESILPLRLQANGKVHRTGEPILIQIKQYEC